MIQQISKKEFWVKMSVIILAALTPFIFLFSEGHMKSISSYWLTDMQPLFIISNAATSYYLFEFKRWRPSAFFLLLLTAFSVKYHPEFHTFLAIIFFIITLIPLYYSNHFKFIIYIYVSSLPFLYVSLFTAETICVISLCLFHALTLIKSYRIQHMRKSSDDILS